VSRSRMHCPLKGAKSGPTSSFFAAAATSARRLGLAIGQALLAAVFVIFQAANPAHAEGSRSLFPLGYFSGEAGNVNPTATRTSLSYGSDSYLGKIRQANFFYVYARGGEYILIGTSGARSAVRLYAPPGPGETLQERFGDRGFENPATIGSALALADCGAGTGNITSRALELGGPRSADGTGNAAGYAPCSYQVPNGGDGIYGVAISNVNATIQMWDIAVRADGSSATDLNGRVFTYALSGDSGAATNPTYATHYYITNDGYRYSQTMRGLAPFRYVLYSNAQGFLDVNGNPLYKDVRGASNLISSIRPAGTGIVPQGPTYPMFFSDVDDGSVDTPDGLQATLGALGIPVMPNDPQVLSTSFTYSYTGGATTYVGQGGVFTLSTQDALTYQIVIKGGNTPAHDDPGHPDNRVLTGIASGLNQQVVWDGMNNSGTPMPPGAGYRFEVTGRAGEVHFPFLDVEGNVNGGPTVTRLNGASSPDSTVYYDDRGYRTNGVDVGTPGGHICGASAGGAPTPDYSLLGVDSNDPNLNGTGRYYRHWGTAPYTGNPNTDCSANGYFGDAKGMDLWTFIKDYPPPGTFELTILSSADVAATLSIPASVAPGATGLIVASFGNVGSLTAADTAYTIQLPANLSGVSCADATCNYNAATGLVSISGLPGSLSPRQWTNNVTLQYTAPASGSVPVTATVTTSSSQPAAPALSAADSDSGTSTVAAGGTTADVLAIVAPPGAAAPGSTVTAAVTFRNLGPLTAAGVTYSMTLPTGLTGVSCVAPANCTYDSTTGAISVTGLSNSLSAGASVPVTLSYTAPGSGVVQLTATVNTATSESDNTNNTNSAATIISASATADVTVSVAPPASAIGGSTVNVPVTFRNLGPAAAANVAYSMALPTGLSGVGCSAPVSCAYDSFTGVVTPIGGVPTSLASGTEVAFTVSYTAPANGTVSFDAGVSTTTSDSNATNNSASAQTAIVPNTHSVSFDSNGGSAVADIANVTHGTTVSAPTPPTRLGYTFIGWYEDASLSDAWVFATDTVTGPTTLYAGWVPNQYTLTYTAGAHGSISGTTPQTVNHGGNGGGVTAVPASGYRFVSWSDGVTNATRTDLDVRSDLTVTANFALASVATEEHTVQQGGEHTFQPPPGATLSNFRRIRGGQQTSVDNPAPADYADVLECSGTRCTFLGNRSGRYELTYTDANGATTIYGFIVHPNVGYAIERQTGRQGAPVTVRVVLDDLPISEEVRIAYSIANAAAIGSPQPSDLLTRSPQAFVFNVGPNGNVTCFDTGHCTKEITFTPTVPSGDVQFHLHDSEGVAVGNYQTHTVSIVPVTMVPVTAELVLLPGHTVTVGTPVTAGVVGLPPGNYSFDWSGSESALGIGSQTSDATNPVSTTVGNYAIRVTVRDLDNPNRPAITLNTWLRVVTDAQSSSVCGSQGCDDDGTRIPVSQQARRCALGVNDPGNAIPYRLQVGERNSSWDTQELCLETSPGYGMRLGTVSFLSSPSYGAGVDAPSVREYGNNGREATNATDYTHTHSGLHYDFEVTGLMNAGASTAVVVPLPRNLAVPADAMWRKFDAVNGWTTFVVDSANTIHSAASIGGRCPSPVSPRWEANPGLVAGLDCVRLVIQDGGPNDADRQANGVIAKTGALGVRAGGHKITSSDKKGGGGAMDLSWLLFAGVLVALRALRKRASMAVLAVAIVASTAQADDQPAGTQADEDDAIRSRGWFLGATGALAMGEVGSEEVTRGLNDLGIGLTARVEDQDRFAWRGFGGYRFGKYLSLEAGYTNLGVVTTYVDGNPVDLYDIPYVLPASGAGPELSISGYLPIGERLDLYARFGVWHWETLYHVHESGQKRRPKSSDTDVLGGVGARYWLSRHWQAGLSYERYRIDEQDVDLLGLNVVYKFGWRRAQREPAPIVSTPPATVAASAPVLAPAPVAAPATPPQTPAPTLAPPPVFLVNFGFDSAALAREATSIIAEAAEYLTSHGEARVEVTGHTDLRGSDRYNLNLSMRRAQAVADALIARGVARERIKVGARGLREPLSGALDEQASAADRRVHITPVR
jgi:uncharacterized repeat protein (TIGR02543 family)/uncharacterized repeat protein (TIGR01451 family)